MRSSPRLSRALAFLPKMIAFLPSIIAFLPSMIAFLPSMIVCLIYYWIFPYRRDYLGHYAAGYGGTLCAIAVLYGVVPKEFLSRWVNWILVSCVLLCIAAGTVSEATVFRLAKFDEVDYCNQNLGAVLAGLVGLDPFGHNHAADMQTADMLLRGWVVLGAFFLVVGGYFAVT